MAAIQLTLVGLDNRAAWPIVIYGFAVILWSVFVTEFWKRDEKRIAMLWGIVRCMNQPVISRRRRYRMSTRRLNAQVS